MVEYHLLPLSFPRQKNLYSWHFFTPRENFLAIYADRLVTQENESRFYCPLVSVLLTGATEVLPKEYLFHCVSGDSLAEGGSNQWKKNLITLALSSYFSLVHFLKWKKKNAFWPPPVRQGCLNKSISWSLPKYYTE